MGGATTYASGLAIEQVPHHPKLRRGFGHFDQSLNGRDLPRRFAVALDDPAELLEEHEPVTPVGRDRADRRSHATTGRDGDTPENCTVHGCPPR